MNDWKCLFRAHILERGWNYHEMGAVTSLDKTEDGYRAVVEGSEDYEVQIIVQDGRIYDMYCNCPYAGDGNYCKHMAAVLYEIENAVPEPTVSDSGTDRTQDGSQELTDVVSMVPEDELRRLVISLAKNDDALYNHLMTRYKPIDQKQLLRLKMQVDQIAYRYSDRGGFVDYRNAGDYTGDLENFLYENVQILIDKGNLMEAFDLVNYVFHEIGNRDMDDSDGGSTQVASTCYEFWKQILDNCDQEQSNEMLRWFQKHQKHYVIDFMGDYIVDFAADEFHDETILREKMQLLDAQIENAGDSVDCGSSYSAYYGHVNNILQRISVMERLHYSKSEIAKYREKHRHFSEIRKLEIHEYIVQGNYAKAIEVLEESKLLDREHAGLMSEYSCQLINLYEKTNQKENYKKEVIYQVFQCRQPNLEYIQKLKKICDVSEWEDFRERLLTSPNTYSVKYDFLKEEKLFERLLLEIENSGSVYALDQYETILKKHFPEDVRNLYIRYVRSGAASASQRNAYRHLMKYLKKITKYPQGKEKAQQIAAQWKTDYKRRSAMMDELKKAGF